MEYLTILDFEALTPSYSNKKTAASIAAVQKI
jgi:hypothetical protein